MEEEWSDYGQEEVPIEEETKKRNKEEINLSVRKMRLL